jgi:hypothetical protein
MTHNLGRLVADGRTFDHTGGIDLVPGPGPLGGPRFVILHFDNVALSGGARLTVNLGYATDEFSSGAGPNFWSRPADPGPGPIQIRISGGSGSARLLEYGSGEPSIAGSMPGGTQSSRSNPDVFLHTNPYEEPIYETRLECNPGFAWRNARCDLPLIPNIIRERVAAATGIIVEVHDGHVSSCSGTLIGPDLFLTARHCLTDPSGEDLRSASVSFDYATNCDGSRPAGHVTRFFKALHEVVAGSPPTGTNPPVALDWVVLRLDAAAGALPAPLDLRASALMVGETIFTMHHPNGAAKKTQDGTHDGGSISGFDFAGGSSGSSLFDAMGRVVGGPLASGFGCSVSFAPVAPIISALTTPPAPPNPLDVMIVFDRSGSMGSAAPPIGRTKLVEAQDAAALFVQLVREGAGDRLGLVTFSSTASLPSPIAPAAIAKPALVGPPPFTGGAIAAIAHGGSTSIGAGMATAMLAYGSGSGNDRAMLLLTDGLQNTDPMIEDVESSLGATKVNAIGFGSDADIDGPLLNRVARDHGGQFTRALDGMALRKFFGVAFGNIFETGAIADPEAVLKRSEPLSKPHRFDVCGEEQIVVVLGWDDPAAPLRIHIRTPKGEPVGSRRVRETRGRSWLFWRIPLPHKGERDGTWEFVVERLPTGGEFPPDPTDVRYFYLVLCSGGPKLIPLSPRRRFYTGDQVDPLVALHYGNRTTPRNAKLMLTVEAPQVALGQLTTQTGLRPPSPSGDSVDAFHATLQAIAQQAGGRLPIPMSTITVPLYDDGMHHDGAMEPDGIYSNRLSDLTKVEGTYEFRVTATYGENCRATRQTTWSVSVEPGIDPGKSEVTLVDVTDVPGGRRGTLVLLPRDRYGNPIGPGRGGLITVSPFPGTQIPGKLKDRGDGSYGVVVVWDPAITPTPGVVVHQPERDPVPLAPGTPTAPPSGRDCSGAAGELLDCLGLQDAEVKRVRVKSVVVEIDMKDETCGKCEDC